MSSAYKTPCPAGISGRTPSCGHAPPFRSPCTLRSETARTGNEYLMFSQQSQCEQLICSTSAQASATSYEWHTSPMQPSASTGTDQKQTSALWRPAMCTSPLPSTVEHTRVTSLVDTSVQVTCSLKVSS